MLVLTRRTDEGIVIQDNIIVTVLSVEGDKVKLGIAAPQEVRILRKELFEAVQVQNLAASKQFMAAKDDTLQRIRIMLRGD
ncbi:MAG: carbon storage regulator CsrA [Anaerolineales bacterium]|nr:carbon storage regulator CsrA [Anaerolineales bacterium]